MINRRGFLGAILAGIAAPAIVRADSLMRVYPNTKRGILRGELGRYNNVRFVDPGTLRIYSGTPGGGGQLLARLDMPLRPVPDGLFGEPCSGVIERNGTASWGSLTDSHGVVRHTFNVGTIGTDGMTLDRNAMATGQVLNINHFHIRHSAA